MNRTFGRRLRQLLSAAVFLGFAVSLSAEVQAQRGGGGAPAALPREFFEDRLDRQGDTMVFCVNEDSMMADFERDLAQEIGNALLLNVEIFDVNPRRPTPPLDYRLPLIPEELFLVLVDDCNAMFGFALSSGYRDYIMFTRPYMETEYSVVVTSEQYDALTDIPRDERIGTRTMSNGDTALRTYMATLPEDRRWRRSVYFDNEILLERVSDGTIPAAIVWDPAIYYATDGDPEGAGFRLLPLPIDQSPTNIGLTMLAGDNFVRTTIDDAIELLTADGTVHDLMVRHNLAPAE